MARRNFVQVKEYRQAKGMDTTSSLPNIPEGFVRSARNCNLGPEGSWEKRAGYRPQITEKSIDWAALSIVQGAQFQPLIGTEQTVLYGTGDAVGGVFGKVSEPVDANVLFFADFPTNSFTPTVAGDPNYTFGGTTEPIIDNINGSFQILFADDQSSVAIIPQLTNVPGSQGTIRFKYTSKDAGAVPANRHLVWLVSPAGDFGLGLFGGVDEIQLQIQENSTTIRLKIENTGGPLTVNLTTSFSAVANKQYEMELSWDYPAGKMYFFIDGELTGGEITVPVGTRSAAEGSMRCGHEGTGVSSPGEFYLDDITVFSSVQHTSNFTPEPFIFVPGHGSIATIRSEAAGGRAYFANVKKKIFVYHGAIPFAYDGINTHQVGITLPASNPVRTGKISTITIDTVVDSTDYIVTIDGTDFTHPSGTGATTASIVAGLVTLIDAGEEHVVATDSSPDLVLTSSDLDTFIVALNDNMSEETNTTGGNLNENSTYLFGITYRNSTTNAESSPKISDPIHLGPGENRALLNFPAGDSSTADEIVIYRSGANSNLLLEETAIGIGSTSFVSVAFDNELLINELELDNSRITDFTTSPTFPTVANGRVFLKAGDNVVRFSKIGQRGSMPESFEVKAFVDTEGSKGSSDTIVGLGTARDTVIVLKDRSLGRLTEAGVPDVGISSDQVIYIYTELSSAIGGVACSATTQVYEEFIFLGKDNIYATNGQTVRAIANPINQTIRDLGYNKQNLEKLSAINDTVNQRIYIAVMEDVSATSPNFVIVGDYRQYPTFRWTVYGDAPQGFDISNNVVSSATHPGINAGSFFELQNAVTGKSDIYFGNTSKNGQYYKMNKGYNDIVDVPQYDSDPIKPVFFEIQGRAYDMDQPLIEKLFKDTVFFAQGLSKNYTVDLFSSYDLASNRIRSRQFVLPSTGSDWGDNTDPIDTDGLWGDNTDPQDTDAIWAGESVIELVYDPHRKAKFYQPVWQQISLNAPVEIFGWGISATMKQPK